MRSPWRCSLNIAYRAENGVGYAGTSADARADNPRDRPRTRRLQRLNSGEEAAMSLEDATSAVRGKAATSPPLGYRVQFDLGDDGVIFWDGTQTPPVIDNTSREADTVMTLSLANLDALIAGALNPTMAYMTGKLKIQGSMGVALKVGQLLEE
jgi:putative sterol carrier protein